MLNSNSLFLHVIFMVLLMIHRYAYPLVRYVDEDHVEIKPISKEFYEFLETVVNSKYYTSNPEDACIFIPSIDVLNENNLRKDKIAEALAMLSQ